jgi:hypothetical protein
MGRFSTSNRLDFFGAEEELAVSDWGSVIGWSKEVSRVAAVVYCMESRWGGC